MLYCYKTAPNVVAIGACERTECDIKYEIVDYMPVADPEQALRATWLHFAADQVQHTASGSIDPHRGARAVALYDYNRVIDNGTK
jgi:hypothetical protein